METRQLRHSLLGCLRDRLHQSEAGHELRSLDGNAASAIEPPATSQGMASRLLEDARAIGVVIGSKDPTPWSAKDVQSLRGSRAVLGAAAGRPATWGTCWTHQPEPGPTLLMYAVPYSMAEPTGAGHVTPCRARGLSRCR